MRQALELCRRVAAGEARCAFLIGPPGNGKTHLARAALHAFDGGKWFRTVPDFLAELRASQFEQNTAESMVRTLQTDVVPGLYAETTNGIVTIREPSHLKRLVVLDDLGTEKRTEWASEQLYRVLDGRYDNGLPTIVTSNVLRKDLDERILSRYAEGLVVCTGKDIRRAGSRG